MLRYQSHGRRLRWPNLSRKKGRSICSKRNCTNFVTCDGLCAKHDYIKNPQKYRDAQNSRYKNDKDFKEKKLQSAKKRYEDKREEIISRVAEKRKADPDGYRKYCRDYYGKNKEHLASLEKKRYWENRDFKLKQSRKSYQKNKDKVRKRVKKYRKDNPEMVKKFTETRYKLEADTFGVTADAYRYAIMAWKGCVMKRDGKKCMYCGKKGKSAKLEAHHIIYKKTNKAMALIENNGIILCHKCHRELHRLNPIKYGKRKKL